MINPTSKQILLIIVIIIIIIWIIGWFSSTNNSSSITESSQPFQMKNNSSSPILYYFYHPSCIYCQKFWPNWLQLKPKFNSMGIITKEIDISKKENETLSFYYGIYEPNKGVPAFILLRPDKKHITYQGNTTINDIYSFVVSNLNYPSG